MTRVAALFVEPAPRGVYQGLEGVDCWDEARDARKYDGPWPVVAHPPCSTWCQLARVNEARYGHKVGDDGGCFESALASVRRWGGVLEHPAESIAWARFGLRRPAWPGTWHSEMFVEGAVAEVAQAAYGHRARKRTWLYAVGHRWGELPELDASSPPPTATVSFLYNHGDSGLPRLSKREAKATPLAFRDLLLSIARTARMERAA